MKNKIVSLSEIKKFSYIQKSNNKTIVLAHGTFDLMHIGHVKHLKFAKSHADILIVTITADKFVLKVLAGHSLIKLIDLKCWLL